MTTQTEIPINIILDDTTNTTYLSYYDYVHPIEFSLEEDHPNAFSLITIDNNTLLNENKNRYIINDFNEDLSTNFYMEMINEKQFYLFIKIMNNQKFYFSTESMDIVDLRPENYGYRDTYIIEDDYMITIPRENEKFILNFEFKNNKPHYLSLLGIDYVNKHPELHRKLKLKLK